MTRVDVLVIGLGPGGSSAAAAAAAAGCSVLAVDRRHEIGVPVQCAEFIPLPLASHARAPGVLLQRVTGMTSVLPSGAVTRSPFPGLMIDRARFDQALAAAAAAAGARLITESLLRELDATAQRARIDTPDGMLEVEYGVLVAADGPHSTVAALLGLPRLATVNTRQYTVPLARSYEDTDIWLSDEYPGGYAWLFPKGRLANLGLGMDAHVDSDMKSPLDRLHRQLVDDGRVGADIVCRTGGAIPVGGLRERLAVGRALFVGDAAGLTHPVTGAGIAAAVQSGERAGAAAAAWTGGETGALAEYDTDVREQYGPSLARAVRRRGDLMRLWRTPAAREDAAHRRGWIAFPEYFADGVAA